MRTHKTITRYLWSNGDGNDNSGFHSKEEQHVLNGTTISERELEAGHCLIIDLFGDYIFAFLNTCTPIQSIVASFSIGLWILELGDWYISLNFNFLIIWHPYVIIFA